MILALKTMKSIKLVLLIFIFASTFVVEMEAQTLSLAFSPALAGLSALALGGLGLAAALSGRGGGKHITHSQCIIIKGRFPIENKTVIRYLII